jgi:heme/copper-type cytochrome/quinol oxidase subunit 1
MPQIHSNLNENAESKIPAKPATRQKSFQFIVGTVLIAGSFLVYPSYPVILLWLPLSASAKAGVSVTVWILSWSAFSFGAYLAGPDGYQWFKALWRRVITGRSQIK